jgi:glycine oxidase
MDYRQTSLPPKADILIIGAGIIGLALAFALQKRGAKTVLVCAGDIGDGASGASAGMVTPVFETLHWPTATRQDLKKIADESLLAWQALEKKLHHETGRSIGLDLSGAIALPDFSESSGQSAFISQLNTLAKAQELTWCEHPADLLAELAGSEKKIIAKNLRKGLLAQGEGQIAPRQTCNVLAEAITKSGGLIRSHTSLASMEKKSGRVISVHLSDNRTITAKKIILATGATTKKIWQENFSCPIYPVKGQALLLAAPPEVSFAQYKGPKVLRGDKCYICLKGDNSLLVGATEEPDRDDLDLDEGQLKDLLLRAEKLLPGLSNLKRIRAWAGIRPGIKDHAPILDQSGQLKNLYYAAGHYRNGVLLAPKSAEIMGDLMLEEKKPDRLFALSRFNPR